MKTRFFKPWVVLSLSALGLTACLNSGGGSGSAVQGNQAPTITGTASNGMISMQQAITLLNGLIGTGEPEDVRNLNLNTSETTEPFDLPD